MPIFGNLYTAERLSSAVVSTARIIKIVIIKITQINEYVRIWVGPEYQAFTIMTNRAGLTDLTSEAEVYYVVDH